MAPSLVRDGGLVLKWHSVNIQLVSGRHGTGTQRICPYLFYCRPLCSAWEQEGTVPLLLICGPVCGTL